MGNELQKDLVLAPNEYAYVLDETKGNISCNVGPHKMSLSQSDKLVRFDKNSKKFIPCERYGDAIQLFTVAPEGWYIALKNPAPANKHPSAGTSNSIPEDMQIGYKVNVPGPASFALYPGQMAQVIKGHSLRSNQYLVAVVYDADSLNQTKAERGEEGREDYVNGQTLIIKGIELSFYIPPTGIEVKAINDNNPSSGYVRDAVTLERLEYCILKDEDGNKRYVHGPEVVFPSPTESFVQDGNNHIKRNAIELSNIDGVYVKVISDYTDEKGVEHKTGEEMFITGKDQMIYYPRPEHTFISYNGKIMHHAIAIPKGEGRYVLNRMTGEIKTIHGPSMYLPDPRFEVVAKRNLTRSQCMLWYPGNEEVLAANGYLQPTISLDNRNFDTSKSLGTFLNHTMCVSSAASYTGTPTEKENNKINRSNTYTQPRTISLDSSKYEGAVTIDVWTGYAVNIVSKDGSRKIVCGPQTIILDYDQTLEMLELSTGKPKTTDNLEKVVFLRHENNQVSDIINVETSDFVKASIKVSYLVNFDKEEMDKWFSVDNYTKHLCDWGRSVIKKAVKEFSIIELCDGYHDIVVTALTDSDAVKGKYLYRFEENGMAISDVEILSIDVDPSVKQLIDSHQQKIVTRALDLNAAQQSFEVESQIIKLSREKVEANEAYERFKEEEEAKTEQRKFELEIAQQIAEDEENKRQQTIASEIQELKDKLFRAEQERLKVAREAELAHKKALAEINADREAKAAESMKKVFEALGPDLAAALTNRDNQATIESIASAIAPYAIAEGMPVAQAISTILRGTGFENIMKNLTLPIDLTHKD